MSALRPGSQFTHFAYNPNVVANVAVVALFSAQLVAQVAQGIYYRTWSFMFAILVGLSFEITGYAARIFMHNDPSSRTAFLMYVQLKPISGGVLIKQQQHHSHSWAGLYRSIDLSVHQSSRANIRRGALTPEGTSHPDTFNDI
jgi:hypothetical protein